MLALLTTLPLWLTAPLQDAELVFHETFDQGALGEAPAGWFCPGQGPAAQLVDEPDGQGLCCFQELGDASFSNLINSHPIGDLAGHGVRLRARLRVQGTGRAQLWLRYDYEDGTSDLVDNSYDRPVTAGDWVTAEIVATVANKPGSMILGVMGFQGAEIWCDDVVLEDLGKRPEAVVEEASPIGDVELANLCAFAELLGYVRYFHPSDAAAEQDWERFAIEGVRALEHAAEPQDLAAALRDHFASVAPSLRIDLEPGVDDKLPGLERPTEVDRLYLRHWLHRGLGQGDPGVYSSSRRKSRVRDGELREGMRSPQDVFRAELPRGLHCRLPLSLWSSREQTFPLGSAQAVEAQATWELSGKLQSAWNAQDRATRLAAVVLGWNVFQHFYPYFDVVSVDWPQQLEVALRSAALDPDPQAFHRTLERLVGALQDGHGHVSSPHTGAQGVLPVSLVWAGSDLVVQTVHEDYADRVVPGDIVLAIGEPELEALIERHSRQISSATPQWTRNRLLSSLIAGERGALTSLSLQRGEETVEVELAYGGDYAEPFLERQEAVEEMEPGYWYLDLSRTSTEDFVGRLEVLKAAKGIVFDLRGYPRDLGPFAFFPHLLTDIGHSAWWNVPIITLPNREDWEWSSSRWSLGPKEPHISAKLAFLTGGGAISYAESCMAIVAEYQLGEIVGEATAGTNGNVNPFGLPGGYRISWTGMRVLKHDKTPHHGVGVPPTIPVSPTVEGIRAGRDEVLEAGLKAIRE